MVFSPNTEESMKYRLVLQYLEKKTNKIQTTDQFLYVMLFNTQKWENPQLPANKPVIIKRSVFFQNMSLLASMICASNDTHFPLSFQQFFFHLSLNNLITMLGLANP